MTRVFTVSIAASLLLTATISSAAEKITLFAGGSVADSDKATEAKLGEPFGISFDSAHNAMICDMKGQRVFKVEPKGTISILAGTGKTGASGDNGPANDAEFNAMHSLCVLPSGDVLLADTWNNRIRKLDVKSGQIRTIIGTGEKGFSGDGGPADKAQFGGIYCAALDPKGEKLYLTDLDNGRIRMVDLASNVVTTVAGNGKKGKPNDGIVAVDGPLSDPRAACVDSKGNLYILERGGNDLRMVDTKGRIKLVVGNGKKGSAGDGGPALQAELNGPKHLCCDEKDNVLIADTENHVIRRYQPADGTIVRVAGTGKAGSAGVGGSPLEVQLKRPHGVTFHPKLGLLICDSENGRILRIEK